MNIAAVIQDTEVNLKFIIDKKIVKTSDCIKGLSEKLNLDLKVFTVKGNDQEIINRVNELDFDLVHILKPGDVVLPGFYEFAHIMIESSKKDFAYSYYYSFNDCILEVDPSYPCQFLLKSWVIRELKECSSFVEMYNTVKTQYDGCTIPSILALGENNK